MSYDLAKLNLLVEQVEHSSAKPAELCSAHDQMDTQDPAFWEEEIIDLGQTIFDLQEELLIMVSNKAKGEEIDLSYHVQGIANMRVALQQSIETHNSLIN